ncbi:hypothetical protein GCM10027047_37300 [Rhodococcus aerolatus]
MQPSRPSSSGGSDSVCQNAPCADIPKMESSHALVTVRHVTARTARSAATGDRTARCTSTAGSRGTDALLMAGTA